MTEGKRLHAVLNGDDVENLAAARELFGAGSDTEAIRKALKLAREVSPYCNGSRLRVLQEMKTFDGKGNPRMEVLIVI